jgi:hypothetical protein
MAKLQPFKLLTTLLALQIPYPPLRSTSTSAYAYAKLSSSLTALVALGRPFY